MYYPFFFFFFERCEKRGNLAAGGGEGETCGTKLQDALEASLARTACFLQKGCCLWETYQQRKWWWSMVVLYGIVVFSRYEKLGTLQEQTIPPPPREKNKLRAKYLVFRNAVNHLPDLKTVTISI
ncbi:hypothetical protein BDZ91DRAFT_495600 [Kalaharituber pfeilii]|nr:hypothetical protein BDZ91DRAFT_495600 [Kalaharituber pfeilii]